MNSQKLALATIKNIGELAGQLEQSKSIIEELVKLRDAQVKTISDQADLIKELKDKIEIIEDQKTSDARLIGSLYKEISENKTKKKKKKTRTK